MSPEPLTPRRFLLRAFLTGLLAVAAALALLAAQASYAAEKVGEDPLDTHPGLDVRAEAAALAGEPGSYDADPVPDGSAIDPPGRVARLSYIEGEVALSSADSRPAVNDGGASDSGLDQAHDSQAGWTDAVLNRPLTTGDKLWVGADARAELQIGSATIHLDQYTSFAFIRLDDEVLQTSLTEGAATIRVRRLGERESVQVETPNASVFLRHPGEYHLEIDAQGDRTLVKVRSGEAQVVGGERSFLVRAGETGSFAGLEPLSAQLEPIAPRSPFESWANERDRRAEQSESARYVSREVIGYEDLDEYGEWIAEPEYGYVWRPSYVASGWAPYRYGHWTWIAPWGWTWIDDARWGFAPFHYGRWARLRNRWCWVPGPRHLRPVYAPALVGWTGRPALGVSLSFGSGIGWFPLAPHELYVPTYRHTPRYVRHVNRANTFVIRRRDFNDIYATRPDRRDGDRASGPAPIVRQGNGPRDYRYARQPSAITTGRPEQFVRGFANGSDPKRGGDFLRPGPQAGDKEPRQHDVTDGRLVRPESGRAGSRLQTRQQNERENAAHRLRLGRDAPRSTADPRSTAGAHGSTRVPERSARMPRYLPGRSSAETRQPTRRIEPPPSPRAQPVRPRIEPSARPPSPPRARPDASRARAQPAPHGTPPQSRPQAAPRSQPASPRSQPHAPRSNLRHQRP